MDIAKTIGYLEDIGYRFRLAIDYECDAMPTPEAEELLRRLAASRESAIDHLLSGRFVPLPGNMPLPAGFRDGDQRIKGIFRAAYDALEKHRGAATVEEFRAAADEFSELSKADPLLCDLLAAVFSEIGRNHNPEGKAS